MTTETAGADRSSLERAIESLEVALPTPEDHLDQDEEWILVNQQGTWEKIRLHDYGDVYAIPGLYEKWVYEIFGCRSPQKIRELLERELTHLGADPHSLTVLDLGAGNGYVAEELHKLGVRRFVGIDIFDEAATAAERDRPGLYDDYVIADLTNLPPEDARTLDRHEFNCLTCVAALGFGDIPPEVFAVAFNRITDGGIAAFTIKTDFLSNRDDTGFSKMISRMIDEGVLDVVRQETYTHRIATDGTELRYDAIIGKKRGDIPQEWIDAL